MADAIVSDDVKKYELMVIINPDLGADSIKKRLEEIRKLLTQKKGETEGQVYFEDVWGLRDMAYSIKKHDRGYYAVFDFTADPSAIAEMDNVLLLENEVLRHMIVNLPFSYEPMTLAKREEEAAAAAAKEEPAVKKGGKPEFKKKPGAAKSMKAEAPAAKAEKAEAAEPAPKKAAPKKEEKKETTLEEVDAKLKSIIDNPDINF